MRPPAVQLGVLLCLALLLPCQGGRLLQETPKPTSYKNLLEASQSEVQVIQQLYNGVYREQGWANTEDFKPLLKVALNPNTNLTAFFPSDDSWQRVADYYCLTQQGVLDNIANLREMLANYIKSHLIGNVTLHSTDFRDGMVLQSMAKPTSDPNGPSVNHTMSKVVTNGTVKWVFKNASIYKIPGTYNYEDITVNPKRMDIRAGNAIIHVIDTLFRNSETERFWEGLRSQVLERAGLPPDSRVCPANATSRGSQETFAPSQIAGMVIGVVIGLLLLAGVLMLIFVVRSHEGGSLWKDPLRKLSLMSGRRPTDGGVSSSPHDGDSPGSGSGEAFTSPLLHLPPTHPLRTLQPQGSLASSSLQTASSWQSARAGGGSSVTSMIVRPDSQTDFMSVVNEESPFAAARAGTNVQHLPAAALVGPSVIRQASSVAGDTVTDSSGGYHRTDSMGSGTPYVSRGSVHGSKKDLLALAAANHGHAGSDQPEFDSLGAGLAPTESVPVGRINHEHVIPFSELTLKELIGSGAEGKVYRGTWKHTDIAAKEYLPIEPAQEAPSSSKDLPSDAAMAHARAALAKEVHWLTSLNHPNLVRFCAVCLERPLVVMEFYKHGSVFAMLQKAARELARSQQARRKGYVAHFNWDRRLEMLHDVAAGMSYLHGKDHVHGDLRSPNLFVGADGKVKIGDFGFTKRLACNTASLKVKRITHPRWVAPELMMDNMMSRASDVYSFGIIMYELLTFRIPFDMLGKEQVVINVVQGFRPDVPEETQLPPGTSSSTCLFTYVRLMKECWAHNPAQRPSFEVIARRLKAMQRWRKIISKHSTLHRAASALRHSSSSGSLNTKEQGRGGSGTHLNGSPQVTGASTDGIAAAAAAAGGSAATSMVTANGTGPSTPALSRARSGADAGMPPRAPVNTPATSQQPTPGHLTVPDYSSSEYDEESLPDIEDFEDADNAQFAASAPVSEAVVAGTRLAVIGVCSHQDERDALASVAGAELSQARKVVLVGSDLPAGAFSRPQSMRGTGVNSLEETRSKRLGSAGVSVTSSGPQLEQAPRFHSITLAVALGDSKRQQQQQQQAAASAATVAAAAAALSISAKAAAAGHSLPPNGKTQPSSRNAAAVAAASAAAFKGATVQQADVAAAAAEPPVANGDAQQHDQQQHHKQQRRHSDPLPPKSRLSADGAGWDSPQCPESATAMSSGQSPFALVHVGPPGLACTTELQQMQLDMSAADKADPAASLRLIESYPLSNPCSEIFSPLTSAAPTPDQVEDGWAGGHGKHAHKQQQQGGRQQQIHQGYRTNLQQQGSCSSSSGSSNRELPQQANGVVKQQQRDQQQDQHQMQQQGKSQLDPQADLAREKSAFESAVAAAASAAADVVGDEGLGEVYTPYDSPFYQDLGLGSWAPSASVCGLDSQPSSLGVRVPSSAFAAAGVMLSSDSGSVASPFGQLQQHLVQAGLRQQAASGGSGVAGGLIGAFDSSMHAGDYGIPVFNSVGEPVLKQALTIEYHAHMTPMAAAAAEAVAVHPSRRSMCTAAGSAPSSRPNSVVSNGPHAAAAAAVAAAAAGASPRRAVCNGSRSLAAASGSSGGSSQDVAACADTGAAVLTAAASVQVDGLLGKAQSAPVKSSTGRRSTTPVSDQQQQLREWHSRMDAPRAGASAADGAGHGPERVRPAWMRLLGIRRSLPGGA